MLHNSIIYIQCIHQCITPCQGQRQRSLQAYEERKVKLEEEKKIMDIEEAKYQSEKRQVAIDAAKTKLYYQSDRIKSLHVGILIYIYTLKC